MKQITFKTIKSHINSPDAFFYLSIISLFLSPAVSANKALGEEMKFLCGNRGINAGDEAMKWIVIPILILCSLKAFSHKTSQEEKGLLRLEFDAGLLHYHSRILLRYHTQFLIYPKEYIGYLEEKIIKETTTEINNELGLYAIDAFPADFTAEEVCKTRRRLSKFSENVICFLNEDNFRSHQSSERNTGLASVFPPGHLIGGIQTLLTADEKRLSERINILLEEEKFLEVDPNYVIDHNEIYEVQIIINISRLKEYEKLKETVKHELLHTLGFGHFRRGVMSPAISGELNIHPEQLNNWKKYVEKKGGFYESYIIMAR